MIVGVIGSGSIGPDLAYGFLTAVAQTPGAKVYLVDIKQEALDAGVARIKGYASKGVARGKLSPKVAAAMDAALVPTRDLALLKDCEYVLEAASEDLAIKQAILGKLEAVVAPSCLIGFATSGLPRAQIAASAKHPARCFVNHPFFPAWRSPPIEVVLSGDAALGAQMMATMKRLGKVPILTADVECFAADDIFCNYISEAARIVEGPGHAGAGRSHRQRRDRRRRPVQRHGRDPRQPAHRALPGADGARADRLAVVQGAGDPDHPGQHAVVRARRRRRRALRRGAGAHRARPHPRGAVRSHLRGARRRHLRGHRARLADPHGARLPQGPAGAGRGVRRGAGPRAGDQLRQAAPRLPGAADDRRRRAGAGARQRAGRARRRRRRRPRVPPRGQERAVGPDHRRAGRRHRRAGRRRRHQGRRAHQLPTARWPAPTSTSWRRCPPSRPAARCA
jgi:hypothetical protein